MKRIFLSATAVLFSLMVSGQGAVGSWSDHLSYSSSYCITEGGNDIYSSAGSSILVYDITSGKTSSLSRISGLNETAIGHLAWCEDEESLVIVYENTGIDLIRKGIVTNIPDIKNKYMAGLKEINGIYVTGSRALLSASFGIVVIDIDGRYVADTWRPGSDGETNSVYGSVILNGNIYSATAQGVFFASQTGQGLSYFSNWEQLEGLPMPESEYTCISAAGDALFVSKPGSSSAPDSLFRIIPGQDASFITTAPSGSIKAINSDGNTVLLSLSSSIIMLSDQGTVIREIDGYGWASPNPSGALIYEQKLWIADASVGLVSTKDYSTYLNYTLPGPYTNNVADIFFKENHFYVTGGTVDNAWGNVYLPFQVFTGEEDTWNSCILYGDADRDAMRVVADPDDEDHFFVSSWGNGLYEFRNGEVINNYNQYNSPLSSIISGQNYTRICGMAFDESGNLWMTQSGVAGVLKALTPDGDWITTSLTLSVSVVGDMVIDNNGYIWVILPRGNGILVYNPAGTPENISDDTYTTFQVEDSDGDVMSNLYSITKDLDGYIWVGTDEGPVVYYSPGKVFSGGLTASRIKIARNDGSGLADYLLSTETVTTIAIDGANRKWFGTMSSGAYLMSDDGKEEIQHFTSSDSPLLSDELVKIAINGSTGDVWFGTSEGIVSYRGTATSGTESYSGLYVFPNPVREDFDGVLTVTGLVENSTVKITDISGNLVFESGSEGGQVTWDLLNYRSERVATGVYLVFCSNEDGSLTAVTKVLIMK